MIAGIVLAAGKSSRMGQPKALLPITPAGPTFLERIIDSLQRGGIDRTVVVIGVRARDIQAVIRERIAGTSVVENPHSDRGQLSSLLVGLDAADDPDLDAALVTLIDMPLVAAESIRAVIAASQRSPRPAIVRATHHQQHGHPVLFNRSVFGDLRRADPHLGAREVVRARNSEVVNLEVDDPGTVIDIDTWDDYERFIGPRPR